MRFRLRTLTALPGNSPGRTTVCIPNLKRDAAGQLLNSWRLMQAINILHMLTGSLDHDGRVLFLSGVKIPGWKMWIQSSSLTPNYRPIRLIIAINSRSLTTSIRIRTSAHPGIMAWWDMGSFIRKTLKCCSSKGHTAGFRSDTTADD